MPALVLRTGIPDFQVVFGVSDAGDAAIASFETRRFAPLIRRMRWV
jgi:hypothetical protein